MNWVKRDKLSVGPLVRVVVKIESVGANKVRVAGFAALQRDGDSLVLPKRQPFLVNRDDSCETFCRNAEMV
jgi:hypothetical protein